MPFPNILERFLSYVRVDTQSSESSETFPSTAKQIHLALQLKKELEELGLQDVMVNEWGYLLATLAGNQKHKSPTIALLAHLDTSPDVAGTNVHPVLHPITTAATSCSVKPSRWCYGWTRIRCCGKRRA